MENNQSDQNLHSQSGSRFNIIPLIIIIGLIYVFFNYDLKSITNNPQVEKNVTYIKTTVLNWWHKVGVPEGSGVFSQFFKTDQVNPLKSTPGISDFINSFKGVDSVSGAKDVLEQKTKEVIKDEATKQLNTWANSKELNNNTEIVPTR